MSNYDSEWQENKEISSEAKFGASHPPLSSGCKWFTDVSEFHKKINVFLVCFFEELGGLIVRRCSYFVIIPFLLGCIAITGLQKVRFSDDLEALILPISGKWSLERDSVEELFRVKTHQFFDPPRLSTLGQYVNLIIKAKERGGNILTKKIWTDIMNLDSVLLATSIDHDGKSFTFHGICAQGQVPCFSPLFPIRPDEISRFGYLLSKIPVNLLLSDVTKLNLSHFIANNRIKPKQLQIQDNLVWTSISGLKYSHFLNFTLQHILGKTKFDKEGILTSSEAISLVYWLRSDTEQNIEISRSWQRRVQEVISSYNSSQIYVSFFSTRTPSDEMEIANNKMKPLLGVSGILMVMFSAICATMRDAVRSKVLLSLAGIFSVFLATGSAFGLLTYFGVSFIGINLAAVFLMLGIGIDDMFVILAAWRKTPIQDSVEKRMRTTYGHAGVSVTITSITNVIAFSVGTLTSIKSIQIFSIYSSFSALLTYIFFITFFGGTLAAFGHLEKNQRHSVFCVRVKAKSESEAESFFYRHFIAGGTNPADPRNPVDNKPHYGMVCIRDFLGAFLNNSFGKACICISYIIYIGVAIFGVVNLEQEKHPDRVSFQQITRNFFEDFDYYFNAKPSFVQIVFTKELDYSDSDTRRKIMNLHHKLESLPFVEENFTTSWIRDWYETIDENPDLKTVVQNATNFVKQLKEIRDIKNNSTFGNCVEMFSTVKNFTLEDLISVDGLKMIFSILQHFPCDAEHFLLNFVSEDYIRKHSESVKILNTILWISHFVNKGSSIYEMDVNLSRNLKRIEASRILIVVKNASDEGVQNALRETVEGSQILGAQVFNYQANIIEQVYLVKWTTIVSVLSTTIVVLFISFMFIPNIACSLWVAFSIVSIELGVVGYMVLWHVKLNSVSMVNLVMCIGFSVDFSTHITYAYMSSRGCHPREWTREAIYGVGLPIILGGLSTIIAVIPGWFMKYVIFTTFYKIIFLAILFGMAHALLFLPTFMALIGPKNFGHYQPHQRLSFFEALRENSRTTGENKIKITGISTHSNHGYSQMCEFCLEGGYLNQESNNSIFFMKSKFLDKGFQSEKLCTRCKGHLQELNLLSSDGNATIKGELGESNSNVYSVSDLASSFDVESVITSVGSIHEGDKKNACAGSLATLDVVHLIESHC